MTTTAASIGTGVGRAASSTGGDAATAWYLYGITRRSPLAPAFAEADAEHTGDAAPLQLLECAELAAVVRPVLLADFDPAVVQERLRNASELEAMVRSHNRAIEAVHARQAILPAKFGTVYGNAADIVAALRSASDTLLPQLDRLDGCDEWAIHLFADRAAVRDHVAAAMPAIERLRAERDAARPGRAFFLERQLREEMESATRQALVTLAQSAFDRLEGCAVAAQANPLGPVAADATDEVEILRAAFLVARDGTQHFAAEVASAVEASEGLRCECTGPWPPYSFAARAEEAR